ncbi:MAG: DUF4351 domain-containing protein [Chloroflexaceae bacterium]|nr:DUF4351 domain-containing protein [Chloroflexaceae bacterium]
MELTTMWTEEGKKAGRVEGRVETTLHLTQRLLQNRLGTLPADLEAQLAQCSFNQLTMLAEALLHFTSQADLRAWLLANPPAAPSNGHTNGVV